MLFLRLTAVAALLCAGLNCRANDSTSFFNRITNFPGKFLDRINKKTSGLDKELTSQTEKYLNSLIRREAKLKKKLYQYDSNAAKNLFASNPEQQYASMLQKIKTDTAATGKYMGSEYMPYTDSLQVSLSFLGKTPDVLNNPKILPADIQNSISELHQLQAKMQDADQLQAFVQARKLQIQQYLQSYTSVPPGITGIYGDYTKQLYYYSQQVRVYKEMLNDPDKMMKTALVLLNRLPAFTAFMQKYSFLAGMFNIPLNYGTPEGLEGLQTRDQVLAIIQNQIGQGGPSAASAVQQSLQTAQQDITKMQDKLSTLGSGNSTMDIPDFKPNMQKTKTFLQRLEYGTNLQTTHGSYYFPTTTDMGLSIGYKISNKSTVGVGASYKIGWGPDFNHIALSSQGMGLRSFVDMQMKKSFYLSGGYEYNYQPVTVALPVGLGNPWQQSGLIGLSKIVSMKTKFFKNTKAQLLWDFLSYQNVPRTQPVIFRVGYSF